ncbi:unnamed protein product [Vicia faba]|uniref:Uncharacterized protein n=1 Tax=Vicia faba TaxID=3906 RepID=A0AAV0YCU5_VICFA|nr:unnamed protein product [Vicia faba]
MVLIDLKRDMIQVIVSPHLASKFKAELAVGIEGMFQSSLLVDIVEGVTEICQTQINADNNKNKVIFTIIDMRYKLKVMAIDGKFKARLLQVAIASQNHFRFERKSIEKEIIKEIEQIIKLAIYQVALSEYLINKDCRTSWTNML